MHSCRATCSGSELNPLTLAWLRQQTDIAPEATVWASHVPNSCHSGSLYLDVWLCAHKGNAQIRGLACVRPEELCRRWASRLCRLGVGGVCR